jgi:replicative DNA helicase
VESLRKDVERIIGRHAREGKQKQSRQAQLTASALGDKINPEAAGHVQAAATEQIVIGLLLLYSEHRHAVLTGQVPLTADAFITSFHRRAFEAIMALEASDGGYEFSMLGECFSPDEMGRLVRLERTRRELSENGTSVLRAAVETLAREREREDIRAAAPEDAISRILESKRRNKK